MGMHCVRRGLAAGVVLSCAGLSQAALLNLAPGDGNAVNGTTSAADPVLAGTIIPEGDLVQGFQIFGAGNALLYEGMLNSRVSISDDTGTLTFSLRIFDTVDGLNGIIAGVNYSGFAGWSTEVEWRTDSLGDVGPTRAQRSADGDTLTYLFGGDQLFSGLESHFFFSFTDATQYDIVGIAEIFLTTGESTTLDVYAPVIPAPGSIALLGAGLGLFAGRRRR